MSSVPSFYKYQALTPSRSQVRLVILSPGQLSDDIHCCLVHSLLDSKPQYEALSYTWGDPYPKKSILVSNKAFEVGVNLETALRYLRDPYRYRTLWIDAICINQDDVDERNDQIRQMRQIYNSANKVIVWIGEPARHTTLAIDFFRNFADKTQDDAIQTIGSWKYAKDDELMDGVADLLFREYWNRVWIIQEILVAHEPKIYIGHESIEWSTFDTVLAAYGLTQTGSREALLGVNLRYQSSSLVALKTFTPLILSMARRQGHECTSIEDYVQTLPFWRGRNATDSRDNLFALYGLLDMSEDTSKLSSHIDYRLTKQEAYMDFIRLGHACRRPLDSSLTIICLREPKRTDHNLPSWVPDFSFGTAYFIELSLFRPTSALTCHHYAMPPSFCCTSTWRSKPNHLIRRNVLLAQGFRLDTIRQLGPVLKSSWLNPIIHTYGREIPQFSLHKKSWHTFSSWLKLALPQLSDTGPGSSFRRESFKNFWHRVCSDASETFAEEIDPSTLEQACEIAMKYAECESAFDRLEDHVKGIWPEKLEDFGHFLGTWSMLAAHRCFAVTESGTFVLAPEETEVSDIVCVLLDCDIPVILRQVDDHHAFVGACYVDRYMDGRAMDEMEAGGHVVKEFDIR